MGDTFGGLYKLFKEFSFHAKWDGELMEVFEQRMTNSDLCFYFLFFLNFILFLNFT